MQIIAGKFKGRKLEMPKKKITRPTRQKARDAIFKIIENNYKPFNTCLDLFAGSGAFGIEALSRGIVKHTVFIEKSMRIFYYLKTNLKNLNLKNQTEIVVGDAVKLGKLSNDCDLIFMDPPYNQNLIPKTLKSITTNGWKPKNNLFICEMDSTETPEIPHTFEIQDKRKYNRNKFLFLKYIK
jgi:16S rRNA (guanine966-N2)-methyltransferase